MNEITVNKKILFFSRSIYPRTGGSSFVTESFAENFKRTEMVVLGEANLIAHKVSKRDSTKCRFYYLRSGLSVGGRGARFLKPLRWLLFPFILWRACTIGRKEKATYVLGTFPEGFFILLALATARLLKLPFSAYFHNTFVENRVGFNRWWATKIQNMVFDRAEHIFVMSDGMRLFYERHYPQVKKFKTLVHTFNQYPSVSGLPHEEGDRKIWKIAFTGNFNESNMEATIRMVDALKGLADIQMNFYTPVPRALLKLRGLDTDAIVYQGYLEEDRYFQELASNDIMVLTHGFEGGYSAVEYETIFPTRIIQMLLTQKPIFAHAPRHSYVHSFLVASGFATLVDVKDKIVIREKFYELMKDENTQNFNLEKGKRVVETFYGPKVCLKFKQLVFGEEA